VNRERVEALIERVMAQHPVHGTPAAQLRYFDAVHQELAPHARNLERENESLRAQVAGLTKQLQARWREASEKAPKYRTVYTCPKCSNVYRAGDQDVTIFAQSGSVYCRKCNPRANPWGANSVMQETREVRA